MNLHLDPYQEKIGYSRGSLWAPFHAVGMVARLRGEVPLGLLEEALCKLQILYPPLASRVRVEPDGAAWLTTEGVSACRLEVRSRSSDNDWQKIFLEQERLPFAFERGPIARFFLLRGEQVTDLVVIVPHVVCDGYSMAQVMFDAVSLLNDPSRVVTRPAPPPDFNWESVPHEAGDNLLLRAFIQTANRVWPNHRPPMSQDSYEALCQKYWASRQNGLLAFELSPEETAGLAARCKQHGLSMTGALVAAFFLAQEGRRNGAQAAPRDITVAANIRSKMAAPAPRGMGVYASTINLILSSRPGASFWELARQGHAKIHAALNNRAQMLWPLALGELNPNIADALLAALSAGQFNRQFGLLTRSIKIGGFTPRLNVSNIGRLDPPELGRAYPLETLLPLPPLAYGGGLALNVLTLHGRMSVILKYRLDQLDDAAVAGIRDQALGYLSAA